MESNWRHVIRSLNRALALIINRKQAYAIQLCGQTFLVCYETRKSRQDRDYPLLQRLAQGRQCVLDVGASHGLASLVMSSAMAQDGFIYAFEASEETCQIARNNLSLNGLNSRAQVINALIAERTGQMRDFYWDHTSGGASIIQGYLGHEVPIKKITLSLDTFCETQNVSPDLVKIDVEGAEGLALAGMPNILANLRPAIVVELHSWREMTVARNAAQILEIVKPFDYQMIYLRTRSPVLDAEILTGRGRCHILLWPVERDLPNWLNDFDTSNL
jgi:FkbM family methyltransferase